MVQPNRPWPKPARFDNALYDLVAKGDVGKVRDFFNKTFWEGQIDRPNWIHLKIALYQNNTPMLRLLCAYYDSQPTTGDLAYLKLETKDNYPLHLKTFRRYGVQIPPFAVEGVSEDELKTLAQKDGHPDNALSMVRVFSGSVDEGTLIDHRVKDIPEEWKIVMRAFHRMGANDAMIAGGALRDLFNDCQIKDVDIFLKTQGKQSKNKDLLKAAFAETKLEIKDHVYTGYYNDIIREKFPQPKVEMKMSDAEYWGWGSTRETVTESWTVKMASGTEYNIIFVPGSTMDAMENFDFGICQIAYDGMNNIITTPAYKKDQDNNQITLVHPNSGSKEHLQRLVAKYPNWDLCKESKKLLPPLRLGSPQPPPGIM